ncbi:uncharacterized protein [Dysidea avara]|uniref:uncharacterized protein n=1 Tax=Dysidea avara TaxID=196820 RepID=UPI0033294F20
MAEQPKEVVLETTMGNITLELYWNHAPKTCTNFAVLASQGYYNNCKFHRIIKDFMIQTGDPTGTGFGGTSIYNNGLFEDEVHPNLKHTGAGVLAMANSGPNTNGSQFYITLAPTPWLDDSHSIFGRVSGGIDTVRRIGLVSTTGDEKPTSDVVIMRAYATP